MDRKKMAQTFEIARLVPPTSWKEYLSGRGYAISLERQIELLILHTYLEKGQLPLEEYS
jgi:hypothetical protein